MMKPIEYLKKHVMTRLRPSDVHGIGVFAIRDIKKGEKVFERWPGKTGDYTLTQEEYEGLSDELKDYLFDMFGIKNYVKLFHDCHFVMITPQFFINTKQEKGTVEYANCRAIADIPKGDELFSNYGYIKKTVI
jgi:hypothetical protein